MAEWIKVESSSLMRVRYEVVDETLGTEFHDGSVYEYQRVPAHVYDSLMMASSKGTYYNENVRGKYEFRRLR